MDRIGMTSGSGPLRILVVDDEPAILRFLRAGLGSQGYVVIESDTGQSALEAVRQRRADLVVLDLGLPDIDGLEVIRRIRDGGAMLQIIVLSSRENEATKVTAHTASSALHHAAEITRRSATAVRPRPGGRGRPVSARTR